MTELSPVEVLQERYRSEADEYPDTDALAAALEALADQVVREADPLGTEEWLGQSAWMQAEASIRFRILRIAAELRRGGANG